MEDYLEAIYIIMLEEDIVRLKKIAQHLSVSAPSALGAVRTLEKENLVIHKKYGSIALTELGEEIARDIFQKHRVILNFLQETLGIDSERAQEEACNLEHHLSNETIDRLIKFDLYLKNNECDIASFHKFYNSNKKPEINFYKKEQNLNTVESGKSIAVTRLSGDKKLRRFFINNGILPKIEAVVISNNNTEIILKIGSKKIIIENKNAENVKVEVLK
jgi:DtxR family Mn-dependent transcriptional regulator